MPSVPTGRRLAALVSIGAVSLAPLPSAALAASAGDQQYVDPLSGSSSPAASHPSSSGSGSGSAGSSSGSRSASSAAPAATSSGSSGSSGSTLAASPGTTAAVGAPGATSGRTLPFTGYDGGLAVALGSGLVAGGVLLRRRLATTDH